MKLEVSGDKKRTEVGGLAGWLLERMPSRLPSWLLGGLRVRRRPAPRLAVLERIALGPRQSLALVEAEGRRFLVATSPEGTPAFYALDEPTRRPEPVRRSEAAQPGGVSRMSGPRAVRPAARPATDRDARVSW
jgi:hypothetical protein